jgi:integrative and conjugative element protein (TIGR02256 family)
MILRPDDEELFVIVPVEVIRTIERYAGDKIEAGGILLGRYRLPHIEIVACSEPLASDIRSFASFDRRDPGHRLEALRRWKDSQGTVTFVGEWHTHPEARPSPSSIDLRTWEEALEQAGRLPLAFIIRGYADWWFGLGRLGRRVIRLSAIPSSAFDAVRAEESSSMRDPHRNSPCTHGGRQRRPGRCR